MFTHSLLPWTLTGFTRMSCMCERTCLNQLAQTLARVNVYMCMCEQSRSLSGGSRRASGRADDVAQYVAAMFSLFYAWYSFIEFADSSCCSDAKTAIMDESWPSSCTLHPRATPRLNQTEYFHQVRTSPPGQMRYICERSGLIIWSSYGKTA